MAVRAPKGAENNLTVGIKKKKSTEKKFGAKSQNLEKCDDCFY
jgi:hypothetical protein